MGSGSFVSAGQACAITFSWRRFFLYVRRALALVPPSPYRVSCVWTTLLCIIISADG